MTDEDWKVTAERVEELFNNKYFQASLQGNIDTSVKRYLAGPFRAAIALLALFGIGAGAVLWHFVDDLRTEVSAVQKAYDGAIAKLQEAETVSQKAKEDATSSAIVARQELAEVRSVGSAAQSSVELARVPLQATANSLGKDISDLSAKQQAIAKTEEGLSAKQQAIAKTEEGLNTTATNLENEVQTVKDQEPVLRAVNKQAKADQDQLDTVNTNASEAAARLENLQTSTEDVSRFKTFEFTTLLRNSTVDLTIPYAQKDAQTKNLNTVYYHLWFVTRAIKRPMDLTINVLAPGGDQSSLTYKDQNVKRGDPQRTSSCICGTPFMFQMDNIQIPLLLRNYATLKVLGRSSKTECELPVGKTKATCP